MQSREVAGLAERACVVEIILLCIYGASLLTALGGLLWACKTDFMTMTIPNGLCVAIALAFFPAWGAASALGLDIFEGFSRHLLAVAIMLLITFVMFSVRIWGAGDSKLASAIALWIGVKGLSVFLLVMALSGLMLVIISVFLRFFPASRIPAPDAGSWPQRLKAGQKVLPYGIAIAAGGWAAFADLGYFSFFQIIGTD